MCFDIAAGFIADDSGRSYAVDLGTPRPVICTIIVDALLFELRNNSPSADGWKASAKTIGPDGYAYSYAMASPSSRDMQAL
jgi:hypothetical protein